MNARTEAPTPDQATQQVADSLALMVIEWVETGIKLNTNWRNGMANIIALRMARLSKPEVLRQAEMDAAQSTLMRLGYTYHGGQLWKPPLGEAPRFDLLDALQSELAKARESIQVRNLGRYGAAYDAPEDKRAYTYEAQPDNVGASRIGGAITRTTLGPDSTDNGLSLLKALQDAGYGVFELAHQSAPDSVCKTCQDHGVIGWTSGQTPESFDMGERECPDCAPAEKETTQ